MSQPRIVPFADRHIAAAARLLGERQGRLRAAEPSLPTAFEDDKQARAALETALGVHGSLAVAAIDDDRLVGFLIGAPRIDNRWDRSAWVELTGHAVEPGLATSLPGDLYAAWAPHMVDRGIFSHMVQVPAAEPDLLEAWYALGFGQMHIAGVRGTDPADLGPVNPDIEVRRATPGDRDAVLSFAELLGRHQAQPPSFSPYLPEQADADRADWQEELESEDDVWLGIDRASGASLGISVSYPQDPGPAVPEGAIRLAATMSRPEARRRGVGRALLRQVLAEASNRGVDWCFTDWRSTNLEASRAWPALGFRVVYLRLRREIDPRIAWGSGRIAGPEGG